MKPHLAALRVAVLLFLLSPGLAQAGSYLRAVSWNLRHEGWSGETDYAGDAAQIWQQFGASSTSPNGCDVVFLQEVMYPTAAEGVASALTQLTGLNWTHAITSAIGRSSYKEHYAVVYRTDTVSLLSSTVYNDVNDTFEREPQILTLRHIPTGEDYTFINWHTIWGTTAEREAEINAIPDVFKSVQAASGTDQDVILLGDHNRTATSAWWARLTSTSVVSPQVSYQVNELTTLNSLGEYANPYDHFWYQATYVTEYSSSGRDYVSNTQTFYDGLSDHAPIWLKLYSSSDTD